MAPVKEGDEQIVLNWFAPANNGGSSITGYKLYRQASGNNLEAPIVLGNVLTYTNVNLSNGVQYNYYVVAVNAIGDSANSNVESGIPFGDCSVENVQINAKTLQMTFKPNGRAIEKIFIVAIDSNPSESDVPSNFFYEVPTGSISGAVTGTFNLNKTFSSFSDIQSFQL